jgi:multidrug efflux pump
MGIVLLTGLSIGTMFTLFIVPAFYVLLGADHAHDKRAATLTTDSTPPPHPDPTGA